MLTLSYRISVLVPQVNWKVKKSGKPVIIGFPLYRFYSLFQTFSVTNSGMPSHHHSPKKNDLIYDKHVRIIFNCGFFIALVVLRNPQPLMLFEHLPTNKQNTIFFKEAYIINQRRPWIPPKYANLIYFNFFNKK